jgi:hypothetical protein
MVKRFREASLIMLVGLFVSSCGFDPLFNTLYPSYLQKADKVATITDFTGLEVLKSAAYRMKMRSFTFPSGREFLAVQIRFTSPRSDDVLLVYTSDLLFVAAYKRTDFNLGAGYTLGNLFAEAEGERILIGFDYSGTDGAQGPKLVAVDPTGASPPVIEADSAPTDPAYVHYLTGSPKGGTNRIFTSIFPNIRISRLGTDLLPSGTDLDVQVFLNSGRGYEFLDAIEDPATAEVFMSFRSDSQGWVVKVPAGVLVSPLIGAETYPFWVFSGVRDNSGLFSTHGGGVTAPLDGDWYYHPWSGGSMKGPNFKDDEDIGSRYFSPDGKYYYIFDSRALKLFRAKTWW